MNVLFVMNSLTIGGAENYSIALMNEFIEMGHKINLIVLSKRITIIDRLSKQVSITILPRKTKLDIQVIYIMRRIIKQSKFDVIVSTYPLYQRLSTACLNNVPLTIYPIHSTIPLGHKDLMGNFLKYYFKLSNEIFVSSVDSQTQYLQKKYHLRMDYFKQIYNGIDTNRFTLTPVDFDIGQFKMSMSIPQNNKIILMVAGFRKEKKHTDAVDAFEHLQQIRKDVTLLFVGNDDVNRKNDLVDYIKEKNLTGITVLSAEEAGDVRKYYWVADLFTLTSNKVETFSISALEALSSGVPCVLTDIGGARDFISNGFNGYLCKANDSVDIANKWSTSLSFKGFNIYDIRKHVVETYSIKNSAKNYIKLFKENIQ